MQTDCFPDCAKWPKAPISALAHVNPRYAVRKPGEYPFVPMAAVAEDFRGIQNFATRSADATGLSRFAESDTLFAKITPCPQNGKIAFVKDLPAAIGLGSTEFIVMSPRTDTDSDPRFLFHLLCSHEVRGHAVARMEGSTGRQRVPEEVFTKRLLVPIPPPEEQRAIARVFDAVDTALACTRARTQRARELERSVVAAAFDDLEAEDRRLREFLVDLRYGTSIASNADGWGNPVLRIPNVISDRLVLDDVAWVELPDSEVRRLELRDGDFLLVRTNGNPTYVGRSAVFQPPNEQVWVYASYLIRARLATDLLPEFLNAYLRTDRGRQELLRRVTTSAGNHNINTNGIRLLAFPLPRQPGAQQRIVNIVVKSRAAIDALIQKERALGALKRSLMSELLAGRMIVTRPLATTGVS